MDDFAIETVADILAHSVDRHPEREALAAGDTRWTYGDLLERVDRLGASLLGLGLTKGDRVGVHLLNCAQAYEIILACARSGLVFVPLNHMLNGRELSTIIEHAGVRALFGERALAVSLGEALDLSPVDHVIGLDALPEAHVTYEELVNTTAAGGPHNSVTEDDLFALMYTSGTTGLPKGVTLTHRNVVAHARNMVRDYSYDSGSVGLIALPYFVGASLNGVGLPCLSEGARVVIQRSFSPESFLALVQGEAVTHVQMVPTLLVRLVESGLVGGYDLDSLRVLGYGSAPMPVARLKEAVVLFGPILYQMYGLTETCAMATCLRPEEHIIAGDGSERLASCGRAVEGIDVRVVNAEGLDVSEDDIGEVFIRGETVTSSYWQMPDVTGEAIIDGWFHTGDLARRDAEGFLYLTDRKKDVIISGGFNIYPKEVEEALYTHPDVVDCAVIGVPDDEWGEAVRAYVALREGTATTEPELLAYSREKLSAFKRPKSVVRVKEIPRNPSGKVLKRVLREEGAKGVGAGERTGINSQ